jgi:uncharacterized protein (DUF2336 family)
MNLEFLDKSAKVTPLLVRLYDGHKLYSLAKDKDPLARTELATAVTEIMEMEMSARESELIADVLIELMRQAEKDLREAISERLSAVESVPLRLALHIANDEIAVARPVLKNSVVLGDLDLIYIIKSQGAEHWQAIADRKVLSDKVMNMLADTGDINTALTLVENENITLTEHCLGALSDIAQKHEPLAMPLLRRDEITDQMAAALYEYVGEEIKAYISENYAVSADAASTIVDEIVLEFADEAQVQTTNEFLPSLEQMDTAKGMAEQGQLNIQRILPSLKRGQISLFVAQFSVLTGLKPETVVSVLEQSNGQGLAVACKAFDVIKPDFMSIYLLTNRVRSDGKMVDVRDINKAVEYYNRVKPDVARKILNVEFKA